MYRESFATFQFTVEKGAAHVVMPISVGKQLNDLPDVLTKVTLFYYSDPRLTRRPVRQGVEVSVKG